jgi:Cu(I)/Ag(I) efflux system membrane protein CusA/SilA
MAAIILVGWGLAVAPFDWQVPGLLRNPVPVDAIPNLGENQQIVLTEWTGRSPQDVEDQVTYPLSVTLLGISGVKAIRTYSMFGFSLIYVIFKDEVDFYWARSRVLENLNSLTSRDLPEGLKPTLGPDATGVGQVFWYSLEGRDKDGKPAGGWDLHELRTVQDWYVRFALRAVDGVSEVASVGGFVQEYQIDVEPDRMRYHDVRIEEVVAAVQRANVDVGARAIEVNAVEYIIRGLGFVKGKKDLEEAYIKTVDGTPVLVQHVAHVALGPAFRLGALDQGGQEAVGGVVVVRHGENPLAVIQRVKAKIEEISLGLPKKTLADGTVSQVKIVPFYDRTGLIYETLGTLRAALTEEILVTIVVVVFMVMHLGSSIVITVVLPLAVLICFIFMKLFGVDANIVALSGIAIAIGTLVDMGIVIVENILQHMGEADSHEDRLQVVLTACSEVGGAVLAAVSITIISFLPVFTMEGPEGKLFKPLAFTKTFALLAALIVSITVIPALARTLFGGERGRSRRIWILHEGLIYLGVALAILVKGWIGVCVSLIGASHLIAHWLKGKDKGWLTAAGTLFGGALALLLLTDHWVPLGPEKGVAPNLLFGIVIIGGPVAFFRLFQRYYDHILAWCLVHKTLFLSLPVLILMAGTLVWLGVEACFGWLPQPYKETRAFTFLANRFPGLGKEFMPPLEEGAYLYMPSTMPHASIGQVLDILQRQDTAIDAIPEVEKVTGKLGRAESALDPAPVSMIETVINYRSKYMADGKGNLLRFRIEPHKVDFFRSEEGAPLPAPDGKPYLVSGRFMRDEGGRLVPDSSGRPFRLWRPALDPALNPGREPWKGIEKPDDIWEQILKAAEIVGVTTAPRLQPISARIVMLQSGIRANMGVKVYGPDLESIENATRQIERQLRTVPSIDASSVIADRIVGKPYLEIDIDRRAIAQYGIDLQQVQDVIEVAIGGRQISTTVQGRERYPVRVRYLRELRDDLDSIGRVLVTSQAGTQIPLSQLSEIRYVAGPMMIRSENTFKTGYVLFEKKSGHAEGDVVEEARQHLMEAIQKGELQMPSGVSFSFTGNYENQIRAEKKLIVVLPLSLLIIFTILYLQFRSVSTSALVFSGIFVAWAGGFIMIWFYAQPWFLDFSVFGTSMRDLFQVHSINLSVAVWVGFLALFGVTIDDGVVMATYLDSSFAKTRPNSLEEVRSAVVIGAHRRVRPCLMTAATTIIALIPVLTSQGRGAEIMVPMAIPSFGGMIIEVISMFIVPVIYCAVKEHQWKRRD